VFDPRGASGKCQLIRVAQPPECIASLRLHLLAVGNRSTRCVVIAFRPSRSRRHCSGRLIPLITRRLRLEEFDGFSTRMPETELEPRSLGVA
jgi:hypothetical protein